MSYELSTATNYSTIKLFSLKVCINPRLINGGYTSRAGNSKHEDEEDDIDERYSFPPNATGNITKASSCSSILRQNR